MDLVIRAAFMYLFLLVIVRVIGKRTMAQTSTFDFVLLLTISQVTEQALVGMDYSLTGATILIIVFVTVNIVFSIIKQRFHFFSKMVEGTPLILVDNGEPLPVRMRQSQVDLEDVMYAARSIHGLEKLAQIKYAVLEKDGTISIIPKSKEE
ncbi:DUF421 domain-containing protein [Mucilaginibacter sp. Bleaf8]|uniref:DUF421 domain-containing protein n=1 Tax=Mucilaginibacter sp. Bleaf8 TaxID=2834430 RepID=UPI001BCE7C91|nr:YetF domain-containing protein [Mucilaginibacter sp. Bleaf8]MBS7563649.1 DUF421 domain-containing protein [Mucilaginibacter sp. Bleaf8]